MDYTMRYFTLSILLLCLVSCAAPNTMMINPVSGELANCSASGWGWAGAPLALMSHSNCIESLQSVGYLTVDEFKRRGGVISSPSPVNSTPVNPNLEANKNVKPLLLKITSNPSNADLYMGYNKDTLKHVETTPFQLTHPQPHIASYWGAECYQVKKRGYKNSEVKCFNPTYKDRIVEFILEKE